MRSASESAGTNSARPPRRVVLISGAGIAGSALAYWLVRYGFTPVIVERAPAFREGGYMIDFWGVGYDVAEQMSLVQPLRATGYEIDRAIYVDERGRPRSGIGGDLLRKALGNRFFSIERGDLARVIFDRVAPHIETIFGDSVVTIDECEDGVEVAFEKEPPRRFDLVVGADGLHSVVRRLCFGAEDHFERHLGYYTASFAVRGYPHRDEGIYLSYTAPGRQVSRYALRDDRTVFFFVWTEDRMTRIASHDLAAQRALLQRRFGSDGWECPRILDLLDETDDLYFDAVSQIRMTSWSSGRVALVGDAAYCPSLLAGEGAAFAMAGAYLLAGELAKAAGDHIAAFAKYEAQFRPFIERKQKSAASFAGSFAPRTKFGLFIRDQVLRLMNLPLVTSLVMRRFVSDRFALPHYSESDHVTA